MTCTPQTVQKYNEKLKSLVEDNKHRIDSNGGESLLVKRAWNWIIHNLCRGNWSLRSEISEAEVACKLVMSHIHFRAAMNWLTQEGWIKRIPRQS